MTPATPGRDDTTGCTCGFGGFHDDINPRCALNAATPGRGELREQIAAALLHRRFGPNRELDPQQARLDAWDDATAVMEPVDTWVAAHTAEVEARLRAMLDEALVALDAVGNDLDAVGFVLNVAERIRAALDPPKEKT